MKKDKRRSLQMDVDAPHSEGVDDEHGGAQLRNKEEEEEAAARQEEAKKLVDAKRALRQSNLSPERPDASYLRSLDTSIKRNTAVIKRLKQINEEQREGLLEELKAVNLSKFVSEAVSAICEAKLKSSDINAAVQVCSLLHQRYKDFAPSLLQGLLKVFSPGKAAEDGDGDRNLRALRKRSTLRLLTELYFCGVIEDASAFVSIVRDLANSDHLRDRDAVQTNLSLLVSFVRQGRVFLGLPLTGQDAEDEIYRDLNIMSDQKKLLRKLFLSFYDGVVELLRSEHSCLRQMEVDNLRMLNAKGELSDESASSYEKIRKSYEQLFRSVASLAEAMDLQPPVMPEDGHTTRVTTNEETTSPSTGKTGAPVMDSIWDDDDTRSFYESLPDLRAFVPAVLLGEAEPKVMDKSPLPTKIDTQNLQVDIGSPDSTAIEEKVRDREVERDQNKDGEKAKEKETDRKGDKENEKVKAIDGANLDSLLQRLPGCVSRDLIDQLTVDFCYVNSKSNRKKLVRAWFAVPRTSLELLPYYSRMVATLSTCMKDVAPMLLQLLEEEFNSLLNKKDQMNIESKIRNIRFIGELAKFKVAQSGLVFSCLKCCLDDFTHHNIDVACNLLETCGRFLYRSPETTIRMGNMLEIIMRLKNVKNLDARHSTMVENAYYQCKPPERSARICKTRLPLHQYIRKLLFSDLDKSSIDHVLRQLRKLPWNECERYILKCFLKVHKGKYSQVHLIASLTAFLGRYHDGFAVSVVDEVLEEIRVGLEENEYGMQQKRIAHMRFLGELYNYCLVDSNVIFDTLFLTIFFGYGTPEQDVLDPPEDCFRLRMIIVLLETCGRFFDRGPSKRKLDRFLMYFQTYVLSKNPIPLDIEFDLQDLFAELRPKMVRFSTSEEANLAIIHMEEQSAASYSEGTTGNANQGMEYGGSPMFGEIQKLEVLENGADRKGENGIGLDETESETGTDGSSLEVDGREDYDEGDEEKYGGHDDDDEVEEGAEDDIADNQASEEEDHVRMKQKKVTEVDPAEEAEFERELRAVMQESLESRKLEIRSRPVNMTIPMNVFESSKDHYRPVDLESGDETLDEQDSGNNVAFRVLVKKGNKQQTKQLHIPRDSSLVQSTKQMEAAELEEKQDIKRLVLEYNDREDDEAIAAAAQPINWAPLTAVRGHREPPRAAHPRHQRRPVGAGYARRK